jgi:hypothetical protein
MEKRIEMYDKILVNDIKNSLEDWMTTHGEITMGSEMTEDVNRNKTRLDVARQMLKL